MKYFRFFFIIWINDMVDEVLKIYKFCLICDYGDLKGVLLWFKLIIFFLYFFNNLINDIKILVNIWIFEIIILYFFFI